MSELRLRPSKNARPNAFFMGFFVPSGEWAKQAQQAWVYEWFLPKNVIRFKGQPGNDIVANCNLMFKTFRDKVKHCDELVIMDHDMTPTPETAAIFDVDADIVGCRYETALGMKSWAHPETFHTGLLRIKREVIESVAPPWFGFSYSSDGTMITDCMCSLLYRKAKELGFKSANAGWAEHGNERSWCK